MGECTGLANKCTQSIFILCSSPHCPLPSLCRLRTEFNIVLSTDYLHCNVLRVKPPMVFTKDDVDYLMSSIGSLIARFSAAQGQIKAAN